MRLFASIYKDGGDCTNDGLSSKHDRCTVIWGESVEEIKRNMPDSECVFVIVPGHCKGYQRAIPLKQYLDDRKWVMFGGNFVYTSDSRFPSEYPIKIHDRYEA